MLGTHLDRFGLAGKVPAPSPPRWDKPAACASSDFHLPKLCLQSVLGLWCGSLQTPTAHSCDPGTPEQQQ